MGYSEFITQFDVDYNVSSYTHCSHLLELDVDIPLTESLFEVLLCWPQNISGMMSLEGTLSELWCRLPYATTSWDVCLSLLGCNSRVLSPQIRRTWTPKELTQCCKLWTMNFRGFPDVCIASTANSWSAELISTPFTFKLFWLNKITIYNVSPSPRQSCHPWRADESCQPDCL